jgi:hypothetical protein
VVAVDGRCDHESHIVFALIECVGCMKDHRDKPLDGR